MSDSIAPLPAPRVALVGFGEAGETFVRSAGWRGQARGWDVLPERRAAMASAGVETADTVADAIGDEPIWHADEVVGWVTSGGYGHHVKQSIALGYVPSSLVTEGDGDGRFEIEIIGRRRPARLQPEPLFDPAGTRMRQ